MLSRRKRIPLAVAALTLSLTSIAAPAATAAPAQSKVMAYFADWDVYARNYHVKDIETSGSAAKLTHINYAFGNVVGGKCAVGDSWADFDQPYDAAGSVNGQAVNGQTAPSQTAQPAIDAAEAARIRIVMLSPSRAVYNRSRAPVYWRLKPPSTAPRQGSATWFRAIPEG